MIFFFFWLFSWFYFLFFDYLFIYFLFIFIYSFIFSPYSCAEIGGFSILGKDENDSKLSVEAEARQMLKKAKVEDDEYKNTTEEHKYYRYYYLFWNLFVLNKISFFMIFSLDKANSNFIHFI